MTSAEHIEFADLDTAIRTQLVGAAESHASKVDLDARLKTVLAMENENENEHEHD